MKKNREGEENQKYWRFVEDTAREVSGWPAWMRGGGEVNGSDGATGKTSTRPANCSANSEETGK